MLDLWAFKERFEMANVTTGWTTSVVMTVLLSRDVTFERAQ